MQRISGPDYQPMQSYFQAAAQVAALATCQRGLCGSVIVKDNQIIGSGYNGPALGAEGNRWCNASFDLTKKPKFDKTCCIHAEWRAVLDACKTNPDKIAGSTLYFMRIDEQGNFTDAGEPYCTVCSRLTMEAGVAYFALWNDDGADVYDLAEYDQKSYEFYQPSK